MSGTQHRNLRRSVAAGASATILVASAAVGASPASAEDDALLPGVHMAVDAIDVTSDDQNLAAASREVVVMLTSGGRPQIRKLRTDTRAAAAELAAQLDGLDDVVAEVNQAVSVPEVPDVAADPGGSGAGFQRPERAQSIAAVVPPLSGETYGALQWGMPWVGAEAAWTVTRGAGITVAVVDTGVDGTHPDLIERTLPQLNFVPDLLSGDPNGHGTHVAGIIGASLDGAGVAGVANQVNILPVRVMNAQGSGDTLTIATGIIAAVDNGAQVINMSIGGTSFSTIGENAVKYAVDRGVSMVAAAGNSFAQGNPVNYPAASPGVLGVASVGQRSGGASGSRPSPTPATTSTSRLRASRSPPPARTATGCT